MFTGMRVSAGEVLNTEEQLGLELVRQLEIVTIRDPDLAGYVKYVSSIGFAVHRRKIASDLIFDCQCCQCYGKGLLY